ncbi:MAG: hypothetical protein Q9221_003108 [Calogaya cf. arnoldii]
MAQSLDSSLKQSLSCTATHCPRLLRLHNEVILLIVKNLEHEDLENFCVCCKDIRYVSASVRASHLALKKEFSRLAAGDLEGFGLFGFPRHSSHTATLIFDALHNADIPRYARELILGPTFDSDNPYYCEENFPEEEAIHLLQQNREVLRARVTCVRWHQTLDDWVDEVCNGELRMLGHGPFYSSILLDLLPHLQELVLVGTAARHGPLGVEEYIEAYTGPFEGDIFPESRNQKLPLALTSLKKVTLRGCPASRDLWFNRLYKMALLPNLRTLCGDAVGYSGIEQAARYDSGDRELEHLHLTTSDVDSRDLSILLRSSKPNSLKTFEYEVGDVSINQVKWQPYGLTDAVASSARDSLEKLRFVEGKRARRVERNSWRSFMGSLRCFSRLRVLHVKCHMLVDSHDAIRYYIYSDRQDWEAKATSVDEPSGSINKGRSIINWLPRSLEVLELVQRDDLTVPLEDMLAGVEVGTKRLPHLQNVVIHKVEADGMISSNWPVTTGNP